MFWKSLLTALILSGIAGFASAQTQDDIDLLAAAKAARDHWAPLWAEATGLRQGIDDIQTGVDPPVWVRGARYDAESARTELVDHMDTLAENSPEWEFCHQCLVNGDNAVQGIPPGLPGAHQLYEAALIPFGAIYPPHDFARAGGRHTLDLRFAERDFNNGNYAAFRTKAATALHFFTEHSKDLEGRDVPFVAGAIPLFQQSLDMYIAAEDMYDNYTEYVGASLLRPDIFDGRLYVRVNRFMLREPTGISLESRGLAGEVAAR